MTIRTFNCFRLGIAVAAALGSFTAHAAGSPSVSFNSPGLVVRSVPVGDSISSIPDPMIVNSTSSPAVISTITLAGANVNEFAVSSAASATCAVGTVIARSGSPNNFCALHFTFSPVNLGTKNAIATVSFTNAPSISYQVSGTSVVAAPVMSFLASTNPTPNIAVGRTGTPFPALLSGTTAAVS